MVAEGKALSTIEFMLHPRHVCSSRTPGRRHGGPAGERRSVMMNKSVTTDVSGWRFPVSAILFRARASGGTMRMLTRLALMLPLLACAAGCSTWSNWSSLFPEKEEVAPDEPAEKLYNEGVYYLNEKHDAKNAAKKFEEVDRQHPYSEWARKALLMNAFALYQAKNYDEAITAAKRYISLHPGTSDAAYAMYLVGASNFDQIPDVSRDQARTDKAIAALEEVVRKFPDSEYAASARHKIEEGRDQLAAKEMTVGRYYQNKKDFTGAINRFKVVVTRYQTTRHVEEALMRLTECYMTLGIVQEAQTAAAVLGHNFPESSWYKDAYSTVKGQGLEPQENNGSWISKAFRRIGVGGT
jgi:outer membrane protein assembly factor BamD